MRKFIHNLIRRLPVRVRAFLPERVTTPPRLTPAERTHEVLADFARELGVDSTPRGHRFWRVLKAAHQWTSKDPTDVVAGAVAVTGAVAGAAAITVAVTGAVAGAPVAAITAAVAAVVVAAIVAAVAAVVAAVGAGAAAKSRVFFYTFLGELALIACAPLVFNVSFLISGTQFALLAGIYFIQGIRGARAEQGTLLATRRLPATWEDVRNLCNDCLRLFVAHYAPEVQGGETRIDQEIAQHEAVRTEAVELKAYWEKRVRAEREKENGDPFLPQDELDRAERVIARADAEIAWLRERKQEMSDALATLKAHLEPLTGALTDYYQIQRSDALEGRQSENTERSRQYIYELRVRVQEDVSRLLIAISRLQERLVLESGDESTTRFIAGAEAAGEMAAGLESVSRQIEAATSRA